MTAPVSYYINERRSCHIKRRGSLSVCIYRILVKCLKNINVMCMRLNNWVKELRRVSLNIFTNFAPNTQTLYFKTFH
jgi:hypothetical protein